MDATKIAVWRPELSEQTREANRRSYVTDVFRGKSKPDTGSIAIGFQPNEDETLQAIGLGIASTPTGIADGKVRTRFDSWYSIEPPVDLSELNDLIARQGAPGVQIHAPEALFATTYSGTSGQAIIHALTTIRPDVAHWVSGLSGDTYIPPDIRQARNEARDAIVLAADVAKIDLPEDAFRHVDFASDTDSLLEIVVNSGYVSDLEEDLIPEDLRRFDGNAEVQRVAASVSIFTDQRDGYQLTVFNVNKKPFEIELGVDLVYWDKTNDAFTLVQYKRLEQVATNSGRYKNDWVYRRESELRKQLALMPSISVEPRDSRDWRMSESPFWFKFVKGDAGRADDELVLRGMYVPAEYLRLAIDDETLRTGPNGGFRLGYSNARYVTRQTFVELLRRGLIGTDSAHSKDLHKVLADLGKTGRQTLIAVKEKWVREASEGSDPPIGDDEPF